MKVGASASAKAGANEGCYWSCLFGARILTLVIVRE